MSKRSVGRGWLIVGILAGCGSSSTQTPSDAGAADTGAATDGGGGTGAVDGATPGADAAAADATAPVGADGGADAVDAAPASATVDFEVTIGAHTGKITRCDWSDGSARQIKMIRDAVNAMYSGELACVGKVDGSETARFVVGLDFYQAALGKTPAADFTIQCTPVGCSGKGTMTVIYDDAALGVLEMVSLANSDSSSGAFILSKFDTSTGEASGSLEMLSATRGALSASVNGTFDAKLFDCKDVAGCNGRGP
jgi:hypothetical protein